MTYNDFKIAVAVLAAIMLFIYGLQSFTREVQALGQERLKRFFARFAGNRFSAFLLGAGATALVQSSSAVSSLTVLLAHARAVELRAALAIVLGANVGTTATAWLVSFKLTDIGPVGIVVGMLLSLFGGRFSQLGKPVFYFGFIFLSLDLMGNAIEPLRNGTLLPELLREAGVPIAGLLLGAALTAVVQSSSVITGLAVLLVQQGAMAPVAAIYVVIGANLGTTTTALVAGLAAGNTGRRVAIGNALFNAAGILLMLPFLEVFANTLPQVVSSPALAVATAHLLFNLCVAAVFLPLLGPVERLLLRVGLRDGRSMSEREADLE